MLGGFLAKSLAAKVTLSLVGLTGGVGAVAAETGALPAPVQNVAHDVAGGLGVPKKAEDRAGKKPAEEPASPKPSAAKESPRPTPSTAVPSELAVPPADGAVPSASGRPEEKKKSPSPGASVSPGKDDKGRHGKDGEVKPSTKPTAKPVESKSPKETPKPTKSPKTEKPKTEKPKPSTSKSRAE